MVAPKQRDLETPMNAAFSDLAARVKGAGCITDDDVMALRAQVYGAETVDADEVQALAEIDAAVGPGARAADWPEFLAEAVTDHVVHQAEPPDFVDEIKGAWLTQIFAGDPRPDGGLEALIRVLEAATEVPASLASFVLDRAKAWAVADGRVDAGDVVVLRRVVFAGGGDGNIGVTRAEADALFDVNAACAAGANDPAWAEFFAKAITDYLTAASPYRPESRDEATRLEAWENTPDSMGSFVRGMAKAPDVMGFIKDIPDILHPLRAEEREWADDEAKIEAANAEAAPITDDEARWLVGRLGQGALSPAEQALIVMLKDQAPQRSGLLAPLLGAPSQASAVEERAPVFGRRAPAA